MSALLSKADMLTTGVDVRQVPLADILANPAILNALT